MDQSLLTAHGAQPVAPSRYKPIWTDRFFTGYFTNRSPLRSPLSAFYADGWQLGKTDTIIDGQNIEISPRLTLIRRPGVLAYNSTNTFANPPLSFYSFHAADGNIYLIADTVDGAYWVTPTTSTNIWGKISGNPARYYGIGTTLYMGDGRDAKAYNFYDHTLRDMGIKRPKTPPTIKVSGVTSGGSNVTGVLLNGTSGYVSTSQSMTLPTSFTVEALVDTTHSGGVISFETAATGTTTHVPFALSITAAGLPEVSVLDATSNTYTTYTAPYTVNDGKWHQLGVIVMYAPNVSAAVSHVKGTPLAGTPITGVFSSPSVNGNYVQFNSPTASYAGAPANLEIEIYLDGILLGGEFLRIGSFPTTPGYWRMGHTSAGAGFLNGGVSNAGFCPFAIGNTMSSVAPAIFGQVDARLMAYNIGFTHFWRFNETSGTSAADGIGSDTGTYQGGFTLAYAGNNVYVAYALSTAYTLGQIVVDSNGNFQVCQQAGTTNAGNQPPWGLLAGANTQDGGVIWTNQGPASINLTKGTQYCYCFVNQYGHFSTASPLSSTSGPQTSVAITVTGPTSSDPNITHIAIFRSLDGGTTPFFVTSIANNRTITTWSYTDANNDNGLNILIAAPLAGSNDPPPWGATNFVYHMGRMWATVGGNLYASGGPDTLVGDGNEAWPAANVWSFPAYITRLVPTASGLFVFTTNGVWMMLGGPAVSSFYPQLMLDRIGLISYNALDTTGTRITFFSNDRQLVMMDTSTGLSDLGFPIGDKLQQFNPALVYVVEHHSSTDHALYIADGVSGWYRCVPQQAPDYQISGPVWSTKATINSGNCGAIASVETIPGQYVLLVGPSTNSGHISYRDSTYSTFTDVGSPYAAWMTVGSIVLAHPGELAEIGFISADFMRVGSAPAVSVLMDEIGGTFSSISGYVVSDPPRLYGLAGAPATLFSNRYYMVQTVGGGVPRPAWCRHLQLKIDFGGTDTVQNEILSTSIYGAILVEGS